MDKQDLRILGTVALCCVLTLLAATILGLAVRFFLWAAFA
jgi:hypothetical protein